MKSPSNRRPLGLVLIAMLGLFGLTVGVQAPTSAESFGGIALTQVTPRIVTPNGDLRNDVVYFKFDNTLAGLPVDTSIFDVTGAKVASMALSSSETALTWDGRDSNGNSLPSGIYIYEIKIGQKTASGSIVLAR